MKLTFETKILGGFCIAIGLLAAIAAVSVDSIRRLTIDAGLTRHTHEVLTRIATVLSTATDIQTGHRGFVITGDEQTLRPYHDALARVDQELSELRSLTADNPRQQQRLSELEPLMAQRVEESKRTVELRRTQGFEAAQDAVRSGPGQRIHDDIRRVVSEMIREEEALLVARDRRASESVRVSLAVIGLGSLLALSLVAASFVVVRRGFGTLHRAERALQQSDALKQAILDSAGYAIIVGDAQGITLFNPGAERLLGYRADEIVGRESAALFHDFDEVVRRAAELTAELGRPIEPGFEVFLAKARLGQHDQNEWTYIRKDGSRVPVQLSVTALFEDDGQVTSFMGIAHDISARKQYEADLQSANENLAAAKARAENADRVKSAFLATMSHELRTPLNSIIGFTGILLQGLAGPLNDEQKKQLEMVRGSSRHLLALINDVLDISKIEAGQLEVSLEPFDLRASLTKVAEITAPLAKHKGLTLRTQVAPELNEACSDQRRVEQILINLLNNAIKFTEQGTISLTATLEQNGQPSPAGARPKSLALSGMALATGESGSTISAELPAASAVPLTERVPLGSHPPTVSVSITDTGIGIRPEDLATLFQPFRQIDSRLSRVHEGTGLGLAICRRLANLLGGEIHAASQWQKGSTFTLTFPLTRSESTIKTEPGERGGVSPPVLHAELRPGG